MRRWSCVTPCVLPLTHGERFSGSCESHPPINRHILPPLPIPPATAGAGDAVGAGLLVSGYPVKPDPRSGPSKNRDPEGHAAFWSRIDALYGDTYGVQYLTPGEVVNPPGQVAGDARGWLLGPRFRTSRCHSF